MLLPGAALGTDRANRRSTTQSAMKTLRSITFLLAASASVGAAAFALTQFHFDPAAFFEAAGGLIAVGGLIGFSVLDAAPALRSANAAGRNVAGAKHPAAYRPAQRALRQDLHAVACPR